MKCTKRALYVESHSGGAVNFHAKRSRILMFSVGLRDVLQNAILLTVKGNKQYDDCQATKVVTYLQQKFRQRVKNVLQRFSCVSKCYKLSPTCRIPSWYRLGAARLLSVYDTVHVLGSLNDE